MKTTYRIVDPTDRVMVRDAAQEMVLVMLRNGLSREDALVVVGLLESCEFRSHVGTIIDLSPVTAP